MLTEQQKQEYLGQLVQFLHAHVDNEISLIEAKRKDNGKDVLIACVTREITVPPLVMGGLPTTSQQVIPVFEFVDPHEKEMPYTPQDPDVADIAPTAVLTTDPAAAVRAL